LEEVEAVPTLGETGEWSPFDAERLPEDGELPCRVGRYLIQSALASGGFSRVYLAVDEELERPVALKLPRPEKFENHEQLTAVVNEARTVARLRHAGIVTVYDVGYLAGGTPYIAMEYVAGPTLRKLLSQGRLPLERTAGLLADVAEAAHYAHRQGLVHRDLKPSNILIDEQGQTKIVDFGLAVHESRQALLKGNFAGTPAYMSPEQLQGDVHHIDGRTDVWSLGVILYEMLTGRRPFGGELPQLIDEIQNREPKPPRQIDDRIPKELEDVCLRCLSKTIRDRYSTSLDVAEALWAWLRSPSLPAPFAPREFPRAADALAAPAAPIDGRQFAGGKRPSRWGWAVVLMVSLLGSGWLIAARGIGGGQSTPVPAPAVRRTGERPGLQPNRWNTLLEHPPEALIWRAAAPDAHWSFESERQEVFVTCSHPAALTLGDCPSSDFQLEMRIAKSAWLGDSGLFWGVHDGKTEEGVPSIRCQALFLHSYMDEGRVKHRLERDFLEFWSPPGSSVQALGRYQYRAAEVDAPDLPEIQLELTVVSGTLQNVRWHGRNVREVCDGPARPPPLRPLASRGRFGIFNEGGAALFRDARIQFLKPSFTPSESDSRR
jgi:predicted Ser/Thr protein kinase